MFCTEDSDARLLQRREARRRAHAVGPVPAQPLKHTPFNRKANRHD